MDLKLSGKKAFITGGSHGIGLSVALSLGLEGCEVIICSRSEIRLKKAIQTLKNKNIKCYAYRCDVLNNDQLKNTIEMVNKKHKYIDILINNVGGGGRWGSDDFLTTDDSVWDDVYKKNVGAAIEFTKAFLPSMKKKRWGRVITITSIFGLQGGGRPWFNIAKFAQTALMKNFSQNREYVRNGITFNSVAPGSIYIPNTGWSKFKKDNPDEFNKLMKESYTLGRLGKPKEVASLVTFLSSSLASYINGASILIDGGETQLI